MTEHICDGVPDGIRTRVTAVKGRCPGPLDDGDAPISWTSTKVPHSPRYHRSRAAPNRAAVQRALPLTVRKDPSGQPQKEACPVPESLGPLDICFGLVFSSWIFVCSSLSNRGSALSSAVYLHSDLLTVARHQLAAAAHD